MNLPRFIQPVSEGESKTCFSRFIWEPMVKLANAIKNVRGENCDVYLSDGRLVVDLINSTRGPNAFPPPDEQPPDFRPPPYNPPSGGWDGNGGESPPVGKPPVTVWRSAKYARHAKTGFYSFSDYAYETDPYVVPNAGSDISYSQNVSGIHYLQLDISKGGSFLQLKQTMSSPGSPNYWVDYVGASFGGAGIEADMNANPASNHGTSRVQWTPPTGTIGGLGSNINRRGVAYWLQNPYRPTDPQIPLSTLLAPPPFWIGQNPVGGDGQILLNQYTAPGQRNNLYFRNGGSFDFIDRNGWGPYFKGELVVDLGKSGKSFSQEGVEVALSSPFTTKMLYQNVYDLLTTIDYPLNATVCGSYVQPTGGSSSTTVPSTANYPVEDGPSGGDALTYHTSIPVSESVFSNTNQNVITDADNTEPSWGAYASGVNYGAMHFRRMALGEGSFNEPGGVVVDLERRKEMVGNHATIYVAVFRVPTEYLAPRFPAAQMPSSATLESVTAYAIGAGNEVTLYSDDSPMYSVWSTVNNANLTTPKTPTVYTTGANAPTLTSNGGGSVTYKFFHGEPYLTWRIYRNTVNNTGTATLIDEVTDVTEREIATGVFRMAYTDAGLAAGTYYYWHRAFWDTSRVSGFSAVTSITI